MSDGWIKTDRGWHKSYGPPRDHRRPSDYPCPKLILDGMDPVEHVDGNFYDSKSAFRRVTRERGYEEIGNDSSRLKPETPKHDSRKLDEAIHKAIAQTS